MADYPYGRESKRRERIAAAAAILVPFFVYCSVVIYLAWRS